MFNLAEIEFMSNKKLILGSASPRRKQLLGFSFPDLEIRVKDFDEQIPEGLRAEKIATFLSEKKAEHFQNELQKDEVVITSDTIVWLDENVLNKPLSRDEAIEMLQRLSGRMHKVFTGVTLTSSEKQKTFFVESDVYFRKLSEEEIIFYVEEYKPFDKAGAYGAQECLAENFNPLSEKEILILKKNKAQDLFALTKSSLEKKHVSFIDKIEGSYFNVMGLPIVELYEAILKW